jgi:hypothetical protein
MRKASPPLLHRLAATATFILIYKPNVSVIALRYLASKRLSSTKARS